MSRTLVYLPDAPRKYLYFSLTTHIIIIIIIIIIVIIIIIMQQLSNSLLALENGYSALQNDYE